MKYTIKQIMKTGEFDGKYGKNFKYGMILTDDKGTEVEGVELSQKPETPVPAVGSTIDGNIEDTQYGKRFKKDFARGGEGSYKNNPETRNEIIRQNALTNAVNFCTSKAALMDKKEAEKYLTGKHVIQVATYFARYSKGEVTVVSENEEKPQTEAPVQSEQPPQDQGEWSDESINQIMN